MAPRKRQKQVQQMQAPSNGPAAAHASLSQDMQPADTLLSLPHAVLAQHVWQLLSPWGRAQLRATCKEFKTLADGLLDSTFGFSKLKWHVAKKLEKPEELTPEFQRQQQIQLQNQRQQVSMPDIMSAYGSIIVPQQVIDAILAQWQDQHRQAAGVAEAQDWLKQCDLLGRLSCVHALRLPLETVLPETVVQRLSTAVGDRITQLELAVTHHTVQGGPISDILDPIPLLCPALKHLALSIRRLGPVQASTRDPSCTGLRTLPPTLESLSLVLNADDVVWRLLSAALGSATQLTKLSRLTLDLSRVDTTVDVEPVVPIAANVTHFTFLPPNHINEGVTGLPALLGVCGHKLISMVAPMVVRQGAGAAEQLGPHQLLPLTPHLQRLVIEYGTLRAPPPASDMLRALASCTGLTSLQVESNQMFGILAAAAQAHTTLSHPHHTLQHLKRLMLGISVRPSALISLLDSGLLAADCQIIFVYGRVWRPYGDAESGVALDVEGPETHRRLAQLLQGRSISAVAPSYASSHRVLSAGPKQDEDSAVQSGVPSMCPVSSEDYDHGALSADSQQGIAAVLGRLRGVQLKRAFVSLFRQEVEAVANSTRRRLWLLPALAHISTLALGWTFEVEDTEGALAALGPVLSQGHLPNLQHLLLERIYPATADLVSLAAVLCARPGLKTSQWSTPMTARRIDDMRKVLAGIPTEPSVHRGRHRAQWVTGEGRRLLCEQLLN